MRYTEKHDIGHILDYQNIPLLKMWSVDISAGKRPLIRHQHLNFEIMMVDSGSGFYVTESETYPMQPGDIFVFPSNEQHCITEAGSQGLYITNLQFDPLYIRFNQTDLAELSFFANTNFCFTHSPSFHHRIEADRTGMLTALFRLIKTELNTRSPEYALSAKSYLYLFLIHLIREHHYFDNQENVNPVQMRNLHRALSYIDQHFTEKITLQELSALAGLTPNYFSALFKQVNKMTLWDYISAKRIDKATRLLITEGNTDNMLDIAVQCGYNNTANFNKTFKKITGMTPREYRNNAHVMIS